MEQCEALPALSYTESGLPEKGHPAKIMMHQTVRLMSVAREMAERPFAGSGKDGLCLLFCLICAENIAKLADDFHKNDKSRVFTVKFFEDHLSADDRELLKDRFTFHPSKGNGYRTGTKATEVREVVDALYDVRCEIVHEGPPCQ